MDKYIKRSVKIIKRHIKTDKNSYTHALNELITRRNELLPLFEECNNKGINLEIISPEICEEYNIIETTIKNSFNDTKRNNNA